MASVPGPLEGGPNDSPGEDDFIFFEGVLEFNSVVLDTAIHRAYRDLPLYSFRFAKEIIKDQLDSAGSSFQTSYRGWQHHIPPLA